MSASAIDIEGVHKTFEGTAVLKGVDWSVPVGSVVGLLGRNGAGKSTLLHSLLGLETVDGGEVHLLGQPVAQIDDDIKQRIGFVPQVSDDLGWMTIDQALGYTALFYANWRHDFIAELMHRWQLQPNRRLAKLSTGERQKVSILRALGHNPDVLVLDEPVAALDPVARQSFISELVSLALEDDKTIVFSTHITSDLERIAADVALLKDGRIALAGGIDDLKERVVRLRFGKDDPEQLDLPGVIGLRRAQGHSVVTLKDFDPGVASRLRSDGVAVDVEHLSLEQIFVELCA